MPQHDDLIARLQGKGHSSGFGASSDPRRSLISRLRGEPAEPEEDDPSLRERAGGRLKSIGRFALGTLSGLGQSVVSTAQGLATLVAEAPSNTGGLLSRSDFDPSLKEAGRPVATAVRESLAERNRALADAVPEGVAGTAGAITGRLAGDVAQIGLTGALARVSGFGAAAKRAGLGAVTRGSLVSAPVAGVQAAGGPESSTAGFAADIIDEENHPRLKAAFEEIAESPIQRFASEVAVDALLGAPLEKVSDLLRVRRGRSAARKRIDATREIGQVPRAGLERLSKFEDLITRLNGTAAQRADIEPNIRRLRDVEEPIRHRQAVEALETEPRAVTAIPLADDTRIPKPGQVDVEAVARQEPAAISRTTNPGEPAFVDADVVARQEPSSLINVVQGRSGAVGREAVQAIAGAGVGAATGAVVSRDPATGAVVGGAIGATSPVAVRKIGVELVRSGDTIATEPGVRNALRAFLRRNFTAPGDLPREVFQLNVRREGNVTAELSEMAFTLRRFRQASRAAFGSKDLPDGLRQRMDRALKGDQRALTDLPEDVQQSVGEMRRHIDSLSSRLIELGAIEGPLAATVTANKGVYATRSYQIFDDPQWAQKVPQAVRNKAKAFIRGELRRQGFGGQELERRAELKIQELLYRQEDGPMALLARGSKLGSKDLSILTKRKGIAPEIRALWGEFDDPIVNYTRSITKMTNLLENERFLQDVRSSQLGRTLFEKSDVGRLEAGALQGIASGGSKVLEPLNGLFTTPEIERAFRDAFDPKIPDGLHRLYLQANSTVKFSKTVLSLQTHVRNVIGNTGFAVANGHYRVDKFRKALRALNAQLRGNDVAYQEYVQKLQRLGVLGESVRANELRAVLNDAMTRSLDDSNLSTPVKVIKRGTEIAATAYRAEDDVWKIFAFENEFARYRKALPNEPLKQLEQRVAGIVRNTYPTYSMVPRLIQKLRRFFVLGSFVSFPWEVGRTAFHTIKLASEELKNPALKKIGLQRVAGIAAAASGAGVAAATSRMLLGVTHDQDEDLRRFMAPWSENSTLIHLGRSEQGNPLTVDLSYTDPYSYLRKPIIAMLRGADWESVVLGAIVEAAGPFLSEEILFSTVADVLRNKTRTGAKVFNPEADFEDKAIDVIGHMLPSFEPGVLTSARRIAKGISGTTTPYGRAYDARVEAAAVFTGFRLQETDIKQGFPFMAGRTNRRMRDANELLTNVARRRGTVSDRELRGAMGDSEQARQRVWTDAVRDIEAARRLGMSEQEVRVALKNAGWNRRDVNDLLANRFRPRRFTNQFLSKIGLKPGEARRRRISIRGFLQER